MIKKSTEQIFLESFSDLSLLTEMLLYEKEYNSTELDDDYFDDVVAMCKTLNSEIKRRNLQKKLSCFRIMVEGLGINV